MGVFYALLFLALSFVVPLLSSRVLAYGRGCLLLIWFVTAAHHLASLYNVSIAQILGASNDAFTFHSHAEQILSGDLSWRFGKGEGLYELYLSHIYELLAPDLFLAQSLVVVGFTIAIVYLLKLRHLLGLDDAVPWAILLFGMEPAMLLWGSVNLREAYQAMFLLMGLYYGIRGRLRGSLVELALGGAMLLLCGLLHHALQAYTAMLFALLLYWDFDPQELPMWRFSRRRLLRLLVVLLALPAAVYVLSARGMLGTLDVLFSIEGLQRVAHFREVSFIDAGGSTYGALLDLSSPQAALVSGGMLIAHYFLGPFPWEVRGIVDIPAMLGTQLRAVLLFFGFLLWKRSRGSRRKSVAFLIVAYLGLEMMWSLGTINYGTAMRHHMVAYGIVVVIGVSGLARVVGRLLRGSSDGVRHGAGHRYHAC